VVLQTADATIERREMAWHQRILSAVAHPQIAYLLFTLGTLGLTIELWNPGAILPGVVGGLCLLLAFFAFQILPISYVGLALLLFGVLLLILEIKVTSFGLLSIGGVLSLLFGSLMLIDSPLPELQIGLSVILPTVLGVSALLVFLARLAIQSMRRRSVTGPAGMLDEEGEAVTSIDPGGRGRVTTHGEIWSATSDEPIVPGDRIQVTAVDGLTLTVRRLASRTQGADHD
jgi:membrane-bound serine protease (ClpP class)